MEYFKINADNPQLKAIEKAVQVLRAGGLIVFPTDTLYGLGVDALNPTALHKLFLMKQRNSRQPVSIMLNNIDQIEEITGILPIETYAQLKKLLPGKFTILMNPAKEKTTLPDILTGPAENRKKVGFRIPDNKVCRELTKRFGRPITSTSANISGEKNAGTIQEVIAQFGNKPALILDAGPIKSTLGSTVLDFTREPVFILREGDIKSDELKEIVPEIKFYKKKNKYQVIFVCSGNINRSPMGKYLLQAAIEKTRYKDFVKVDSAGTLDLSSQPAHELTMEAAQEYNLDMDDHVSKPISKKIMDDSELVLCLAVDHQKYLRRRYPEFKKKIVLLKQWQRDTQLMNPSVADPMGHSRKFYEGTFKEIALEVKRIFPFLISEVKDFLVFNEVLEG